MLLHFSLVTPNQQLKQPFQTFAALPVDETTQQTSQIQTSVQDELSVDSDRAGVISKDLFKSLILSAVSLDDAVGSLDDGDSLCSSRFCFRDQGFRRGLAAKSIRQTRPGKQECLENTLIQSTSQQIVRLEQVDGAGVGGLANTRARE